MITVKIQQELKELEKTTPPINLKLSSIERVFLKSFFVIIEDRANYSEEIGDYRGIFPFGMDKEMYQVFKQLSKKV